MSKKTIEDLVEKTVEHSHHIEKIYAILDKIINDLYREKEMEYVT